MLRLVSLILLMSLVGCPRVDLGDVHDRFGALGGTLTVLDGRIEGSLPCAS